MLLKNFLKKCTLSICFMVLVLFFVLVALNKLADNLIDSFGSDGRQRDLKQYRDPFSSTVNWTNGRMFPVDRPFTILSINYHESPKQDLINLLEPLGVRIVEKGINTYGCHRFNTCRSAGNHKKDLLTGRAFHWLMSDQWMLKFYLKYRNDPDWNMADAFICFHPAATCELFLPFNKPIIIWTTIRVDNGRMLPSTRQRWLENLRNRIAPNRRSVVAANNRFDVEYTRYFTGVHSVLLPSFCGYTGASYNPVRNGFLVYRPQRANEFLKFFMDNWLQTCVRLNISEPVSLISVNDRYPNHRFTDLAEHRGIVYLPFQPSMMSIFEQYRMNIPLFFPSLELLVNWQLNHNILTEMNLFWFNLGLSFEPFPSQAHVPHPYAKQLDSAVYWLKLADWYSLPHIIYYNSFTHLAQLLHSITDDELLRISRNMREYNEVFRQELVEKWRDVLFKIASNTDRRLQGSGYDRETKFKSREEVRTLNIE